MKYTAIILAAGSGSRMNLGYNKMFFTLKNKPLITLSIQKFLDDENCTEIIIVGNEKEIKDLELILKQHDLYTEKCMIVSGSYERQYSVYNGLQNVTNDIVLVHDGARPFITRELIHQLVEEAKTNGCCIPGVKVKDTIKYVNNNFIKETLPREFLYAVQTPQACQTSLIKKAHELAKEENFLGTDEASLVEKYTPLSVKLIESNYENIKITTKEDLIYAERLYDKYFN
ncbi:2-C-methyl-D-erythritol 4-phosphate cytidylyltransferase [Mycoplasmatota bacterium]|nr:2-C-methyl-D-erythritol 4-phosphate cytidylyltransferase [Mycoplasmatota bacterium]